VSDLKAATAALLREDHLRNGRPSSPTYDHHKKPAGPETPPEFQSSTNGEGRSQTDADPEKALPGPEFLKAVEGYISRYVILPSVAYLALALWAIATHAALRFDCFPYVALISAAKRSGKTRLMEVLELIVRAAWRGTAPSPAALYRMLGLPPTLMLDEAEMLNGKNKSEPTQILLAVLNAGHRRGASIPRCEGPKQEVRLFPVYGPKLFAAIGRLPDTLMDRSIVIRMQRRSKDQPVARFRPTKATAEAKALHDGAAAFVRGHEADIDQAYQALLEGDLVFLNDRDADLWIPLFAICFALDSDRLPELKKCATTLSDGKAAADVDDSYAMTLLRDLRLVWPKGQDDQPVAKCETAALIEKLKALEESPWLEHQLTPRKLARMLKPFDVEPRTVRIEERTAKGYHYEHLKTAFDPYLDDFAVTASQPP
jgi:hypothetical protein